MYIMIFFISQIFKYHQYTNQEKIPLPKRKSVQPQQPQYIIHYWGCILKEEKTQV